MPATFHWTFQAPLREQTEAVVALALGLAPRHGASLSVAAAPPPAEAGALVFRAAFPGEAEEAEERGRAFWLELHGACNDENVLLELVDDTVPEAAWRLWDEAAAAGVVSRRGELGRAVRPARAPAEALAPLRAEIPAEPVYDLLRADDPELDANLSATIAWIERAGLPVINLLSYLDLPLFRAYADQHPEEREQNLFLHMLHTWTCYRYFGAAHARLPAALAEAFTSPIYLRLNTTQFRSPAPAWCLQFEDWTQPVRGPRRLWAKEIYLTHLAPPTPADDRELTLMIVTHDDRGEFGFIPLEIPLSLPGVGESIAAFFAPGEGDDEWGANSEDLHRLAAVAATYCLYASAADPARYLAAPGGEPPHSG